MGSSVVINSLRDKPAHIAGEIKVVEHVLAQRRERLARIDAVLRMFTPDFDPDTIRPVRPAKRGLYFIYGQLPRMCHSILREAGSPVRFDVIVDQIAWGPRTSRWRGRSNGTSLMSFGDA